MMLKKIYACLIVSVLLFTGCANNATADNPPETSYNNENAVADNPPEIENNGESASKEELSYGPSFGGTLEDVLFDAGMVKFNESFNPDVWVRRYSGLKDLTIIYEAASVKSGLSFRTIHGYGPGGLNIRYDDDTNEAIMALFAWSRTKSPENAVTADFNRGAVAEYIEEHNGITYGITEWVDPDTNVFEYYGIGWAQHGQRFSAVVTADFTMPDIFAFCNAVPITTWELSGDAISVSVQGMDNVGVIDGEGMEIIAEDDVLYRVDGAGMERIGYRWLTDEGAGRYQYVLEPGEYQFSAVGGGSGAELLVKHFETGDCVSSADYTQTVAGQAGSRFILTVSGDPGETAIDFTDEGINPK